MRFSIFVLILLGNIVFGHVSVEAQRIVFDRNKSNTQSIVITNNDSLKPFLAQIWIEDEYKNQVDFPIVALPFLQRVEPRRSYQVRVSSIGDETSLAKDRETLFYFNLLGVPPKEEVKSAGGVQLYVQYRIKLFYRPIGLKQYEISNGWIEDVAITRYKSTTQIDNQSPYYVSVSGYLNGETPKGSKHFNDLDLIIRPFSQKNVDVTLDKHFSLMYTTDIGRTQEKYYTCPKINTVCLLVNDDQQ